MLVQKSKLICIRTLGKLAHVKIAALEAHLLDLVFLVRKKKTNKRINQKERSLAHFFFFVGHLLVVAQL